MNLIKRVHGVIFVAGVEGVSREQLANSLEATLLEVDDALQQLKLNLQTDENSPVELANFNEQYRLVTKAELQSDVEQYAQSPFTQKLTRAAIETLAIVAYRQPITRMGIDEIRGVSSANVLQKLLTRDLIKEVGRVEAPGRPVLYGVTHYFMDYFGLNSLNDLPQVEPLALNDELASDELFSTKKWQLELFEDEDFA
ncbi:SMC-Scp complex subunit ScpB [Aerococcaceae bacterium NML191292]|nr:SMC-Scp complex subunit ScpB [Aerococcaceae bacterium NML210727]MCW6655225.1 SMC-Scp complex subunit ScpB [Aerococcaceae bacterium NML201296]MCW6659628.1 SMC-Scp complex subunit ScpB [Aerococcaceae bacterium NML191292]MCW6662182.1 SMC-Scp complex subunit ScpB [Aerococcaceae bacterium NML201209]MCW6663219.1 SMC-Scp complex subunit ScpB [Aerococcaceae bacterium NML190073]MCW6667276.1 SMC-Scp complex subunit ScpB [Aerococcaceae bacterium NML190938]MCW6674437.1 SMC-Scp complex subunit ScpB [Ae